MFKTNHKNIENPAAVKAAKIERNKKESTQKAVGAGDKTNHFLQDLPDVVCLSHLRWDFVHRKWTVLHRCCKCVFKKEEKAIFDAYYAR